MERNLLHDLMPNSKHAPDDLSANPASDALARLTRFGWWGGLALIAVGMLISFFAFGYFVIYWRNADMDLVVIYNALLLNDGRAQSYFDHPGSLTILSLAATYRALHALGLIEIVSFAQLPPALDVAAFEAAMTALLRWGRLYSLITGLALLAAMTFFLKRILRDWRLALLGTFALAFSGGMADHIRILRTELLSAGFVTLALLMLIHAARTPSLWRPFWIGLAALLCALGLANKVQAIVLIAALPLIVLPFGVRHAPQANARWHISAPHLAFVALAILVALLCAGMAWPLIATGLNAQIAIAHGIPPVIGGRLGLYQSALALWTLALVLAFAQTWRITLAETLATLAAMIIGGSLGLMSLNIHYDINNIVAVLNPLEKMWSFATYAMPAQTTPESYGVIFLRDLLGALARYTFVLHSSPRPAVFLTWLIVPGIVMAWRRGERQLAIQCLFLFGAALCIDTMSIRRGLKLEYFVYTDPLLILAALLLLDRFTMWHRHRAAYAIGVALIGAHIVLSQAEPVKHALARSAPQPICDWAPAYMPLMKLPFCVGQHGR